MPIILRVTEDMFEFSEVCHLMINPVNLLGVAGAGLALEFRRRVPSYIDKYKDACRSKELRIGTLQIIEETDHPWAMLNFPTKRHYQDTSSKEDIIRGLEALRELLLTDKYRHAVIGMPMLGCGLGKQDYDVVYPLMVDHLSDLEATIFLSMSPQKTNLKPKYLMIVGPIDYGYKDDEKNILDWVVEQVLKSWNTSLEEYTAIVSGGYKGVDDYFCGRVFNKEYQQTYAYQKTNKIPIVIKESLILDGAAPSLKQTNVLCEIADDVILFKPKGHNNNRMSAMQIRLEVDKEQKERDGLFPKRVAVFGEKKSYITHEDLLVNIEDIPY